MVGSNWAKDQNGPIVKIGQGLRCPTIVLFTSEQAELTLNRKKETNVKWAKDQHEPRVKMGQGIKMGHHCLPSEGDKLTVNSNKETNGRVK